MGSLKVRAVAEPHSSDPAVLRTQRDVYRRNQTPVRGTDGRVQARHQARGTRGGGPAPRRDRRALGRAGRESLDQGPGRDRGWNFADMAVRHASDFAAARGPGRRRQHRRRGRPVAAGLLGSGVDPAVTGRRTGIPAQVRSRLPAAAGLDDVRIHNDASAHAAADALGARAVTAGRSIYMGAGEYEPSTPAGQRLLAHEIAHTIQQDGATDRPVEQMGVSTPGSPEEVEAERFADAVSAGAVDARCRRAARRRKTSLMRHHVHQGKRRRHRQRPRRARKRGRVTFQIAAGHPPGAALQLDHGHHDPRRRRGPVRRLPGRPAPGPPQLVVQRLVGNRHQPHPSQGRSRRRFATPSRAKTGTPTCWHPRTSPPTATSEHEPGRFPGHPAVPLANPVPPRVSTRGWFNYGVSFVSYISARDTTDAVAPAAFQHLAHCYWNMSLNGTFDRPSRRAPR